MSRGLGTSTSTLSFMNINIMEYDVKGLESYVRIPIAFEVSSVLEVTENLAAAPKFLLNERRLAIPYLKDYDAIPGNRPTDWPQQFDMSQWRMFIAEIQGQQVGGAIVARKTPELTILEGRDDLAVLWDLRVTLAARGQGVGAALFRAAEDGPSFVVAGSYESRRRTSMSLPFAFMNNRGVISLQSSDTPTRNSPTRFASSGRSTCELFQL